jgi:hypothetical protein
VDFPPFPRNAPLNTQANKASKRYLPALTRHLHPAYSVIEEFVEGFVEGFLARNITLTPRLSKHDREPDSHYLTS